MLSVPLRWVSSTSKRDLPIPRARKSISSGHDTPLTDTHVDPVPTVHADASSDQKSNLNNPPSTRDENTKPLSQDDGKGKHVDYSI